MIVAELLDALVDAAAHAARAASRWTGCGDPLSADAAATDALRDALGAIRFRGRVAIGEGRKDRAPGLFAGETVGRGWRDGVGEALDLAIDPIDGTLPLAQGRGGSVVALAAAAPGALHASDAHYLQHFALGPAVAARIDPRIPLRARDLVHAIARARRVAAADVSIAVLDRPRHAALAEAIAAAGARVRRVECDVPALLDVAAGLLDASVGVAGTTECVIGAAALAAVNGRSVAHAWRPAAAAGDGARHRAADSPPIALVRPGPAIAIAADIPARAETAGEAFDIRVRVAAAGSVRGRTAVAPAAENAG